MLLQLKNIYKSFGSKTIFEDLNLELHAEDVVGIVGKNGQGKTTLLRLITRELRGEMGTISIFPEQSNIVYHEQFLPSEHTNQTVESYVMSLFPKLYRIYRSMQELSQHTDEDSINELLRVQEQFVDLDGYEILGQIDNLLSKLGLTGIDSEMSVSQLSGGQKTRLQFAKLVLQEADILLLDEPTNHLDCDGTRWLEEYIQQRKGITVIVSHDRAFLNNVTNKIFELNEEKYTLYAGNYDEYKEHMLAREQNDFQMYKSKMKEIDRLSTEVSRRLSEVHTSNKKFIRGWEGPVVRKKAGKKAKAAKTITKKIESQIRADMPDKPIKKDSIKLDLKPANQSSNLICKIQDMDYFYGDKNILKNINLEIWQKDRLAIVGPNGSGKTTLLKIIAQELVPTLGIVKIGENVQIGYFSQELDVLDQENTVLDEFRKYVDMTEQDARTYLYYMLFAGNQVFQKINTLSQGEKSKLMLAILLTQGANFLILDEPTNHLDIASREVLENALFQFTGTLCVVSHDQYFLEKIGIDSYIELD